MTGNAVVVNFSGGETSPRSRARFDQPWYQTSARKMVNFIAEVQGPARFRPGLIFGYQTRLGAVARGFDFEINDVLAYLLEFTPGYLRVRNPLTQNLLTTTQATITAVTKASPAVVTVSSAAGLVNGKEVILSGMAGMPELNNKQFLISGLSGTTFKLADPVTGTLLDTTAYPAVGTAGTASVVYELTTPYSALDLQSVEVAATDGRMYLVCPRQVPQKLTVDAYGNFSISAYSRTNDPFALSAAAVTITDLRPEWVEDQRAGIGGTITPGATTGSGITFTASVALFSSADVGKYIRSLIAPSETRVASGATLTLSAVTGTGITFTASAAVFAASDVGSYIRDLSAGAGVKGYALITGFTNSTTITCTIISNFAAVGPIASGAWSIESTGYAKITAVADSQHATCTISQSFGSTAAIAAGSWAIITVETQVTLASTSIVNASITYLAASVAGATQINGNTYYLVALDIPTVSSGQRFYLRGTDNSAIDSSAWGTYSSGGTLTPSSSQASLTLTGVTRGTTTIVTFASGSVINPNVGYTFSAVGGTVQLNGATYWLKTEADGVHITLIDGTEVDSSAWGAWTAGGIATASTENPLTVAFYEGRLVFGGTNQRPDCLFLSRSPDNNGNSRYDDFTGGTNADFACFFQLAPTGGSASFISWTRGGPDYLFVGTFGGPYRVSGSGLDIPITPSSINVRQFDTAGCEETAPAGLQQMFFVQRAGATLRSIKVINPYLATFESADMCLNAEQIGYSPIQRVVLQRGRPDILWVYSADGTLSGMSVHLTVQAADTLTGWHRHKIGGSGKVVDLVTVPRQTGFDQLWAVVQRTINGATRCYFEVMADDVTFPDPEDFFGASGPIVAPSDDPRRVDSSGTHGSKALDLARWANAVWRAQDGYIHMDSEISYDGSLRGVAAGATLTPSAVGAIQVAGQAAVPITLTASQAVFTAADVGSEIWVKPDRVTGVGAGRATITAYMNSTHVSAVVTVPFSSVSAVAAGDWYFAVSTFYGFGHLEGAQVAVVADGAVLSDGGQTGDADFPTITVTRGTITLAAGNLGQQQRAAVLRAGLPYTGMLETHNLEMGGRSGPAQSKPRNISEIYIRFMNSLGCEYGTDLYGMDKIDHRLSDANSDRPAPVFSGLRRVNFEDVWSGIEDSTREKNVFVCQRLPLPAVVQFLDLDYATADDGGME